MPDDGLLSFQDMIGTTVERYGKIDCLVNNAGYRT